MSSDSQINLTDLKKRINDVVEKLDLPSLHLELEKLTVQSGEPDLWQEEDKAKKVMSTMAQVRETIASSEKLLSDEKNLEELIEMSKSSKDDGFDKEVEIFFQTLVKSVERVELVTFLSGKYDLSEAIVSIKAGQGGTEAMDWASMLSRMYTRFFEKRGWTF